MRIQKEQRGFTMVEAVVVLALLTVVLTAGSLVFLAGQNTYSITALRGELQENARRTLQRISYELQESGRDNTGTLQVTILNGAGTGGSDILRFTVPLCVCGISPIDPNGEVSRWGAPSQWGQAGCDDNYPTGANGKVDVCHYPPGNPGNAHTLNVSVNAVKAHLAHGDHIGACGTCDPVNYNNRIVEYSMDNSGHLIRRVLSSGLNQINSSVFARQLTDFQTVLSAGQNTVTVTVTLSGQTNNNRTLTVSNATNVILRNF